MRYRPLLASLILILSILACNLPSGTPTPTAAAAPPPTAAPTQPPATAIPSNTPLPTDTPLPTATATPAIPIAWPKSVAVNCRYGPGTAWAAVSALQLNVQAEIAGRNAGNDWWYIKDPLNPGDFCWVAMSVTNAAGNLAPIPIVAAPEALVTGVSVNAEVTYSACGGPNPIQFSGKVTTNGPTTITYQWEITGDKQNTTSPETLKFDAADTKSVPDPGAYSADCGNYAITLHVTDPNEKSAKKNFKVGP